jgi:glycerophosphoryl diester phosphodiesterase
MAPGELRARLQGCANNPLRRSPFSIGHRGAPLGFPEHTRESYLAAAAQGAGSVECDVTFTRDKALVCRHSQCDLHTTTNILLTPLAARCSQPFRGADPASGRVASARCCTSDITLAEFRTLCGRRDSGNPEATTVAEYLAGGGESCATLMTHAGSIALFRELGVDMIPELKAPETTMPFAGDYTQEHYASAMIEEYRQAAIPASRVQPQSFSLEDIRYWRANYPEFGQRAILLDDRLERGVFNPGDSATWIPGLEQLKAEGVRTLAPPMPALLALENGRIVPSAYARAARAAQFRLITWTLERSGPLDQGGGFYYASIRPAIHGDGDLYPVLDVLAREVGIAGIFSDWPATVTYYANCTGR